MKKLTWREISLAIVVSLCVLFLIFDKSCQNKTSQILTDTATTDNRATIIDSMKYIQLTALTEQANTLVKYYSGKLTVTERGAEIARENSKRLAVKADSLEVFYKKNHTLNVCDSLVNLKSEQIKGLTVDLDSCAAKVDIYSRITYLMHNKSLLQDTIIQSKISLISEKDRINTDLRKRLKQTNNWWHRNEKWIFLGAGAVGARLILR